MNELALFAGAGGGVLAGTLLGWRTVCAVEIESFAASVLRARQRDGLLEPFPVWGDVSTFDGEPWRGLVDIVTGGFPCQDISSNGNRRRGGTGLDGERSGLWHHMARVVRDVQPRFVFVENSPELAVRGLDVVLGDMASLGFDAEWSVLGADDLGAPHRRKRMWILGHANGRSGCTRGAFTGGDAEGGREGAAISQGLLVAHGQRRGWRGLEWPAEPELGRVADGVAHRLDRLRALGNGQVPRVAAAAFTMLRERGGW